MGQKNSSQRKIKIYYEYTYGTIEDIKNQIIQKGFVFESESYCCYLEREGIFPKISFTEAHMGNGFDLKFCSNFDTLLQHLHNVGKYYSDHYGKQREKEHIKLLLCRIKTLVNLGFASDIDYDKYQYEDLKYEVETAKKKQQEYFDNVSRIGKYIREKESQELAQEEGSAAVKN